MTEFFKLDSSYYPNTTISKFDTLIWTERYQKEGEFQLVVDDYIDILTTLPLGTLLSHTDTLQVMIVENHEIERDKEKKLKITVSGRSFETFAENRVTYGPTTPLYDPTTHVANVSSFSGSAEAAAVALLVAHMVATTDPTQDAIPNLSVYSVLRAPDSSLTHIFQRGDLYARVMELLNISDAGIKTIRPVSPDTTLDIVIHDGLDLTGSVIFYAQYEDLEDAKYLWSIRGYKNYAQVTAHDYARIYQSRDVGSTLSGLNRRVMYVPANDIEGNYSPGTSTDAISTRGQSEIDMHKQLALLQAKIATTARPKFKIDYDVGDLVTVFGEFSTAQTMRVTEHILTIDKNGLRGYPSLSVV